MTNNDEVRLQPPTAESGFWCPTSREPIKDLVAAFLEAYGRETQDRLAGGVELSHESLVESAFSRLVDDGRISPPSPVVTSDQGDLVGTEASRTVLDGPIVETAPIAAVFESEVRHVSLQSVLELYSDGDEHGWQREFDWLWSHHTESLDALAASIQEVGIREPIVLGSDGRVWDGHHRLAVAKELALAVVPVRFAATILVDQTRPTVVAEGSAGESAQHSGPNPFDPPTESATKRLQAANMREVVRKALVEHDLISLGPHGIGCCVCGVDGLDGGRWLQHRLDAILACVESVSAAEAKAEA